MCEGVKEGWAALGCSALGGTLVITLSERGVKGGGVVRSEMKMTGVAHVCALNLLVYEALSY